MAQTMKKISLYINLKITTKKEIFSCATEYKSYSINLHFRLAVKHKITFLKEM